MGVNVVLLLLASSKSREKSLRGPELIKVCSSIFRNQQTNLHLGHRVMRAKHNRSLCMQVCAREFVKKYFFYWSERRRVTRRCNISQPARSLINIVLLVCRRISMSHSSPGGLWGEPGFRTAEVSWLFLSLFITEMFKQCSSSDLEPLLLQNQHILGNWLPGIFWDFTHLLVFTAQLSSCLSVIVLLLACWVTIILSRKPAAHEDSISMFPSNKVCQ